MVKSQQISLEEQYQKFPKIKRDEVLKLVQWIRAQPHLGNTTEEVALMFFHACRYSMEAAKRTIDINQTVRTHCPEFFGNLDIERAELQKAAKTLGVVPLAGSTAQGYRVVIGKLIDLDSKNFNFHDVVKFYCMIFDRWMLEDGIVPGYIIVMDLKGFTLSHLARISIMSIKKFLYFLQEAAPIRLVGLHYVNIVPFMDKLMALMSPFMKKELMSVLKFHNSLEDFYKVVPKYILPGDYGGPLPNVVSLKEIYYNKVMENRQNMLEYEKTMKVNEKLRPGKPKNVSDLFGIEGNFKKLDID